MRRSTPTAQRYRAHTSNAPGHSAHPFATRQCTFAWAPVHRSCSQCEPTSDLNAPPKGNAKSKRTNDRILPVILPYLMQAQRRDFRNVCNNTVAPTVTYPTRAGLEFSEPSAPLRKRNGEHCLSRMQLPGISPSNPTLLHESRQRTTLTGNPPANAAHHTHTPMGTAESAITKANCKLKDRSACSSR